MGSNFDEFDPIKQKSHRLAELDFRRTKHRLPVFFVLDIRRGQLLQFDTFKRPAMHSRYSLQLLSSFRHADIKTGFGLIALGQDDLHSQRGFPAPEPAFDEVKPTANKTAAENIVDCVRLEMVVEVSYVEWTPDGLLRHVVYLGEREDKSAGEVLSSRPHADAIPSR